MLRIVYPILEFVNIDQGQLLSFPHLKKHQEAKIIEKTSYNES